MRVSSLYSPFHIRLIVKLLQSNKITRPNESTKAAKFPNGDMIIDKIERLLSGILESIGKKLD